MISAKNITKYYGKYKAVDNVSFGAKSGEIFGFLGANGAGKSTIIKLLVGLNRFNECDGGTLVINGQKISSADDITNIRQIIGYMPEERVLIDDLTGSEYVDFVAKLYAANWAEIKKRKEYYFNIFSLTERKNHLIRFYSNGMKKKVLIIGALIHNPQIIIVDEPFTALDPESVYILKKIFQELAQRGCTVMLSSHNLEIVEDICSRIIILNKGKTLYEGNKVTLLRRYMANSLEESYVSLLKGSNEITKINDYVRAIPYSSTGMEE